MSTNAERGEHPVEPAEGDREQGEQAEARVRAQQEADQAGTGANDTPDDPSPRG
jgi:hypothetical protein